MQYIGRALFTVIVCAGTVVSAANAQDSTAAELPPALLATSGIESGQRSSVASFPGAGCPLTPSQVTAVRAGVLKDMCGAMLSAFFARRRGGIDATEED